MKDIRQLEIYKKIWHSWERNGRLYIGAAVLISILIGYAIAIEVPEEVSQVTATEESRSGMTDNHGDNEDTKGKYGNRSGVTGSKQGGYGNKKGGKGNKKIEGDDKKGATCIWCTRSVERPYALRDPFSGTIQKENASDELALPGTVKEPVTGAKRGRRKVLDDTSMIEESSVAVGVRPMGWRRSVPALQGGSGENRQASSRERVPRRDFQLCGILEGSPSLALVSVGGVSCALASGEAFQGYVVRQITSTQVLVDTPEGAQWYVL